MRDSGAIEEDEPEMKTPESSEHDLDDSFDEFGERVEKPDKNKK